MSFRINTNINAMNSYVNANNNNKSLTQSLERLSSGLRINKAADDASGLAIADKLRSQSNSLGQAINNANDGIGIIQIADKAMDEQLKILDTIKTKATQAAQDGQTSETRKAIQQDITKLLTALDDIATTTSFNGQSLLNGSFTNKEFQVGAYSNQTVGITIGTTHSSKTGSTRFETSTMTATGSVTLQFSSVDGTNSITLEAAKISTSVGTGVGVLANVINKNSDKLGGVKASWTNLATDTGALAAGIVTLAINGVNIGTISVAANDTDGNLVNAINEKTGDTGVEAFLDTRGRLNLRSTDGRGMLVSGLGGGLADLSSYGNLTLQRAGSQDIIAQDTGGSVQVSAGATKEATINLATMKGAINANIASAIGANENANVATFNTTLGTGVTTLVGAMAMMEVADSAIRALDKIRSDLGSAQNQFTTTVNNISVTQVNVKAAESQIRDVDFAQESATFQKHSILAQSGSYALSQANQLSQNIQRLLQ